MVASVTSWIRRLKASFDAAVVRRGEDYARRGRVRIVEGSGRSVEAVVRGTHSYTVTLLVERVRTSSRLNASCTCPYSDSDLCKHIWATLCVAAQSGHLAEGARATYIVHPFPELVIDDEDDVENADDDDDDISATREVQSLLRGGVSKLQREPRRAAPPLIPWRDVLTRAAARRLPLPAALDQRHKTELAFVLDLERSRTEARGLCDELRERSVGPGQQRPWKRAELTPRAVDSIEDVDERALVRLLTAHEVQPDDYYGSITPLGSSLKAPFTIAWHHILVVLAKTGRGLVRTAMGEPECPLVVDPGDPYRLVLVVDEATGRGKPRLSLRGELRRGDERVPLSELTVIFDAGFAFLGARAVRVDSDASFAWVAALRASGTIAVTASEADDFLRALVGTCGRDSLELPPAITSETSPRRLATRVHVRTPTRQAWRAAAGPLEADIVFDYGGSARAGYRDPGDLVLSTEDRRLATRDRTAELDALDQLASAGFKLTGARGEPGVLSIAASRLTQAILTLPGDRFVVEADGVVHRRCSSASFSVRSGIDWFDLDAHMEFDGVEAPVPALLEAARRKQHVVRLGDGSVGLLPDAWIARLQRLLGLSTESANTTGGRPIRFGRAQVPLVEAVLGDDRDAISWDGPIASLRRQLATLERLKPSRPPRGFVGELRPYQREGLAWLEWLETVGLSGCLADDMGLGKTVQVLALLAGRRRARRNAGPSLVVAPRSVVFNWLDEARRFTPGLRVIEFRPSMTSAELVATDLVVTTYGLLRQWAGMLSKVELDYVILDEAHAIKNPAAATTKAARLLRARHRLALTGTPVENHLGELASLFDFLTPGLFGSSLREASKRSLELDADVAAQLGRGLRPFLLRRKKADVLSDLPPRIEQTIHCVMAPPQRAAYEAIRRHYQTSLLARVRRDGVRRSAVHVLEALLRLRQVACHPGLVDEDRRHDTSAKLEALSEQLSLVVEQGKKALVFSQFTTLLDIVESELERGKISFTRLDGKTSNRKERVARFQTDPSCSVFLVSLKAGGVGLNLTAAEYVFLLDPWWNPAAEAQAIDRAHRMGQTRTVVSYRLLCKDTVEDRIALLQEKKRALVASVFSETGKTQLGNLSIEDVEALLS